MASSAQTFETLPLARREIPQPKDKHFYRIYKDAVEFTIVEAITALEALKVSGLSNVYKVLRETLDSHNVLTPDASAKMLLGGGETPPPAVAATETAAAPATAPAAAEPAKA